MRGPDYPDCFVVINGPEDGTEFPVVRAPFHIGSDPSCAVNLRLDDAVRELHVLVSAVSDGYRIRRNDAAPVYVNGKRAGMFRSRVVRSGGKIQVGNTLLCIECSPDGLASRSHGVVTQSDLGWVVTQSIRGMFRLCKGILKFTTKVFGRLLGSWVTIGACLVLLYLTWPMFRQYVNWAFNMAYYKIWTLIYALQ